MTQAMYARSSHVLNVQSTKEDNLMNVSIIEQIFEFSTSESRYCCHGMADENPIGYPRLLISSRKSR